MAHRKTNLLSLAVSAALALLFLLALAGCGSSAELKTGRKLIKAYLSGRSAAITESYVEMLRPDGTKAYSSDYVKGAYRIDGEEYAFAVNTVTGEIYTSEKLAEFTDCCVRRIADRLGLDAGIIATECIMELYVQPWQEESEEWPWERSYLGEVLPVALTDMDAWVTRCLADEDTRILLYIACRDDELYDGRWSTDDLTGWSRVEIQLFGFAADEPLPSPETFPEDYHYVTDRPRMTLLPNEIRYRAAE